MYINMTPDKSNKTLHASQDDTTRQFKFKLVNDSQVLDTSDSIPPVIYDVEPNGVEQLLPVNSSTPTTSPIIADIKYPDELREDQEFFERITPTTIKGQAKIEKIKGNTLVFNQLAENGNLESTSGWGQGGDRSNLSVANNIGTATLVNSLSTTYQNYGDVQLVQGHKIFIHYEFKVPRATLRVFGCENNNTAAANVFGEISNVSANTWYTVNALHTVVVGGTEKITICYFYTNRDGYQLGDQYQFRNLMVIDLTLMFGAGNEPTSVSDFTNLFPLPYYNYDTGSLLSFNGTGIKSVGKNLLSYSGENLPYNANGVSITRQNNIYKVVATNPSGYPFARISTIHYLRKGTYTVLMLGAESSNTGIAWRLIDRNVSPVKQIVNASATTTTFTLNEDVYDVYFEITIDLSRLTAGAWDVRFQLNMGTPIDYEPYTENTIDLPTSTFFPTGMKSAGAAYDELTSTKATTRIGMVDLGSLTWVLKNNNNPYFYTTANIGQKANGQALCAKYPFVSAADFATKDKCLRLGAAEAIQIRDSSYTSATDFKTAMSGVYLYYELATPTEEDIESYSLVSENVEKPLEYDNGFLVCDSDGLTTKAGFIPCKIKQIKGDQTIYSQLINLHIERRP